ncbi:Fe/S bioproteinis protein NfuA (plasmid) [Maritalea myrionectae]|uniref:Fe/S bioproteinis protein NfuA n=1 Tax=Maritalea myrionectae TaxID=454601 RepID=A0A2R4MJ83_9HYPH|nr:NifU family protein [Maritalea myrionectae]AVX06041.1 Fe/S bioproteinis protein NfuA [Maritalea myrionectae]
MSEVLNSLRIRAQSSPRDPDLLRFLLDVAVQDGASAVRFDNDKIDDAPLARALFEIGGVRQIEVDGASINVYKKADANWDELKSLIATAIRTVFAEFSAPLGNRTAAIDKDAEMLATAQLLMDSQINPSIAKHGGHISVERVVEGSIYLRMSGGCQGCAASELTLRAGVERKLRAGLPDLQNVIDITDHESGDKPFYTQRPSRLGGTGLLRGWSNQDQNSQAATDVPLTAKVRKYLEALPPGNRTVSYGKLARAMGFWTPGSVRRITHALEETMREDAAAGRPFIAARAVSRFGDGLPANGFFALAKELKCGPANEMTKRAFHMVELDRLVREVA